VWFERLHRPESGQNPLGALGELSYASAKERCELPTWADRRAFLELLLGRTPDGPSRINLARLLEQEGGDSDAAAFVRRETVRRAQTPEELEAIRGALRANEPDVGLAFVNEYAKANGDAARLAVVESYLRLSPHDARLRRRQLALFEALHQTDDLFAQSALVRQDPFLNAALLADDASALRRAGREDEARRTFGELVERAPNVPFARAFLGDRMLDEGLYDEATTAYEALLRLVPEDPGASFRLALAHAGAGRLDVASRMFARVAQTGGRTSDPALQELASFTSAILLAEARAKHPAAADEERLGRRILETPLPDVGAVVLVRAPTWVPGLRASTVRDIAHPEETPAPLRVPSLGIAGVRVERGEGPFRLRLGRQADLEPSRHATARVEALVLEGDRDKPRLVSKEVPLPTDGTDVDVAWDGTHWL
jgi:Ca-activated chloride channel family protein